MNERKRTHMKNVTKGKIVERKRKTKEGKRATKNREVGGRK
jgi:hypothetical protein